MGKAMVVMFAWTVSSLPSVLVAAVSAHRLFEGGSAWWLLGLILAAILLPTVSTKGEAN